jgi:hypothetical protein
LADICKSQADRVVLVEGKDDCHVILALAKHHGLPEVFGIYECGNDENVLKRLNALIVSPDSVRPKAVGVVLDATVGRWEQLTSKLAPRGYMVPPEPDPNGTILDGDDARPMVGAWFMPDNANEGMLEDLLISCAPPNAVEVAKEAVKLAKLKQVTTFKDAHHSKAVIHTYLAWQDEPGRPLGLSLTSRVLSPDTAEATRFVAWLHRLFP